MTLADMRGGFEKCTTRKQVIKLASRHLRDVMKTRCDPQLIVVLTDKYGGEQCIRGRKERFDPFLSDEYVVLKTATGCDLSIAGLTTMDVDIVITSDTVSKQQKKGYNTLLRAVAVIVAYVEKKVLRSEVSNVWSAYTLLKEYQTSVTMRTGETILYKEPLTKEDAMQAKAGCREVMVRPTKVNFDIATRILHNASVECPTEL